MAKRLSKDGFARARAFVATWARPLDQALLNLRLQQGEPAAVLNALVGYQNDDGGFGHGLEPDLATPASTAIATSVGLRVLSCIGAAATHPMVRSAMGWLAQAFDADAGVWPIVGPEVDLAPHAPWWSWSKDLADNWNGFRFNPSAELLGYLYRWRDAAPPALVDAAEAAMRRTLAEAGIIEGAYDLKCAARLAEAPGTPPDLKKTLIERVVRSELAHDPADEHGSALDLAATPLSPFAEPLAAQIDPAIDALITAQDADGGWPLFWDWSFVDAAAWAKAKADWRGWLTREALETLIAWRRVEAPASA
ncbi:MAG TPA: hypothetical protein VKT30_04400 [Caulobacteraceae bacterium]|nr:hypothetical protein [Caulobacteraceae bacterium]